MPLSFGGWGLYEKSLWILITFIDYITRHSFRGYTHISRSQHDTHRYTKPHTFIAWGWATPSFDLMRSHLYSPSDRIGDLFSYLPYLTTGWALIDFMLDKQPYSPFFGLYYMVTTFSNHLSINYTISIHESAILVKSFRHKKTQTYLLCHRSSVWVKFLLCLFESSWSDTHCVVRKGGLLRQLMRELFRIINTRLQSVFNL